MRPSLPRGRRLAPGPRCPLLLLLLETMPPSPPPCARLSAWPSPGDWLFSRMDDLDAAVEAALGAGSGGGAGDSGAAAGGRGCEEPAPPSDGPGEYELVGCIRWVLAGPGGCWLGQVMFGRRW